eukprot:sb/3462995/
MHYGQSSSPPIPDSSFSAVVAQQQRRTSLSQPMPSGLSSLVQQTAAMSQAGQGAVGSGIQSSLHQLNSTQNTQSSMFSQQNKLPPFGGSGGGGGSSLGHSGLNGQSSGIGQSGFGGLGQQQQQGLPGQHVMGQQMLGLQGLVGQYSQQQQPTPQQQQQPQQQSQQQPQQQSQFPGNFDQSFSSISQTHYTKDIEDEANSYFQQIIIHKSIPLNRALDMLSQFESSTDAREKDIFGCMMRALFEEYKFFNQYPEPELKITGKLFGGIIERGLVAFFYLGVALRFILEALTFRPNHKIYMFGISAIEEFKHKLKGYPQYCRHLKEKNPNYNEFPPWLKEYIEHGAESQEPPSAKLAAINQQQQQQQATSHPQQQQQPFQSIVGGGGNNYGGNIGMGMFGQQQQQPNNMFPSSSSSPHNQMSGFNLQSLLNNKGSIGSAGFGNIGSSLGTSNFSVPPASSPNILGAAHQALQGRTTPQRTGTPQGNWPQQQPQQPDIMDDKKMVEQLKMKHQPPPEAVRDKILFIFNNISQDNIKQKSEEWLEIVEQQFYPWAAQYLITERTLQTKEYADHVLQETYNNIKILLKSPTMSSENAGDKSYLKNLGSFLGIYTLSRNKPILQVVRSLYLLWEIG